MNDFIYQSGISRKFGDFEFLQDAFKIISSIIESSIQKVDKIHPWSLSVSQMDGKLEAEESSQMCYIQSPHL